MSAAPKKPLSRIRRTFIAVTNWLMENTFVSDIGADKKHGQFVIWSNHDCTGGFARSDQVSIGGKVDGTINLAKKPKTLKL